MPRFSIGARRKHSRTSGSRWREVFSVANLFASLLRLRPRVLFVVVALVVLAMVLGKLGVPVHATYGFYDGPGGGP